MKKILALILALSMALSLAACGNGSDDTPVTAPADTEANEPEVTEPEVTTSEVATTEEATTEATTTEPEPVLPIEPAVVETITDGENTLERLSMEGFTVTGSTPLEQLCRGCRFRS